MVNLGLLVREIFGWGQGVRSGQIKRLSKIISLHALLLWQFSCNVNLLFVTICPLDEFIFNLSLSCNLLTFSG